MLKLLLYVNVAMQVKILNVSLGIDFYCKRAMIHLLASYRI